MKCVNAFKALRAQMQKLEFFFQKNQNVENNFQNFVCISGQSHSKFIMFSRIIKNHVFHGWFRCYLKTSPWEHLRLFDESFDNFRTTS